MNRLWERDLRDGKASLTQYPDILHAEHPLGEAFDIADEAQPEDDAPKFMIARSRGATSRAGRVQDRVFKAWAAS